MTYDPAEYFRLTSDVPSEEEMDLAEEMQQDDDWQDEVAALDREEQR